MYICTQQTMYCLISNVFDIASLRGEASRDMIKKLE